MYSYDELRALVMSEDWEMIEGARGARIAPHVPGLIQFYGELSDWTPKIAIVQLLQDQPNSPELRAVMLDVLRAPDVSDWFQDTVELTKASALGFLDERYDTFMAFYNDRELLASAVSDVLSSENLRQESITPAAADPPPPEATNIMEAIAQGEEAALQAFIAAGVDLDGTYDVGHVEGVTPLIYAIMEDQIEAAEQLLAAGADPDKARDGGQTPLSWAVFKGHREFANKLMDLGADVQQTDQYGETLAKSAAQYGYVEILADLIARGAKLDGALGDGRTAIWFAAHSGQIATTLQLIDAGIDINGISSNSAPLHLACRSNSSKLVTTLIERGADINLRDTTPDQNTPLMIAAKNGYANIVRNLLKAGADPSLINAHGQRAADLAGGKRADEVRAAFL